MATLSVEDARDQLLARVEEDAQEQATTLRRSIVEQAQADARRRVAK